MSPACVVRGHNDPRGHPRIPKRERADRRIDGATICPPLTLELSRVEICACSRREQVDGLAYRPYQRLTVGVAGQDPYFSVLLGDLHDTRNRSNGSGDGRPQHAFERFLAQERGGPHLDLPRPSAVHLTLEGTDATYIIIIRATNPLGDAVDEVVWHALDPVVNHGANVRAKRSRRGPQGATPDVGCSSLWC